MPEVSGQEIHTSTYIAQCLQEMGIRIKKNIAGYGVLGILEGDPDKKCVAVRADMDALPIQENNRSAYQSLNQGVMHACGHDAHMAMVLGAAQLLSTNRPQGTVKFIFQPREEKPPGGAKDMIKAGVLEDPKVDGVIATHITNAFPCGTIALADQMAMALADDFHLSIFGRGSHGAEPHKSLDTILITAQVIQALQNIVARRVNPVYAAVISIGTIHGGTSQNIIPDRVDLTGTVRCLDVTLRDEMLEDIHQVLSGITSAWGANYELNYIYGYPPVKNHPLTNGWVLDAVASLKGSLPICLQKLEHSMMAGEDFAYFGLKVPSTFFFTGAGNQNCQQPWHNNCFDIDEDALVFGSSVMATIAWKICSEQKQEE